MSERCRNCFGSTFVNCIDSHGQPYRGCARCRVSPLCLRCSGPMNVSSGQLCRACFEERAKAVYWDREPACSAKGPTKAECLLPKGHDGDHEGNGFDAYGPLYRCWSAA